MEERNLRIFVREKIIQCKERRAPQKAASWQLMQKQRNFELLFLMQVATPHYMTVWNWESG